MEIEAIKQGFKNNFRNDLQHSSDKYLFLIGVDYYKRRFGVDSALTVEDYNLNPRSTVEAKSIYM